LHKSSMYFFCLSCCVSKFGNSWAWENFGKKIWKKHVFSFIWFIEWENYGIVEREKNLETNIEKKYRHWGLDLQNSGQKKWNRLLGKKKYKKQVTSYAAARARTHKLWHKLPSSNDFTQYSLISIIDFLSSRIILNRVWIDCLRPSMNSNKKVVNYKVV
jgi:hypothetical protein